MSRPILPFLRKTRASTRRSTPLLLLAILSISPSSMAQTTVKGRRSLVLEGKVAQLVVDLAGGSITDFHLMSQGLSPINWGQLPTQPLRIRWGTFSALIDGGNPPMRR